MLPVNDAVVIPFVKNHIGDDGAFMPNDVIEAAAEQLLSELARAADAMQAMRTIAHTVA